VFHWNKTIRQQADIIAKLKTELSQANSDLARRDREIKILRERLAEAVKDDEDPPDWLLQVWRNSMGDFPGLPHRPEVPSV